MKSSFHRLILFLIFLLNYLWLPFPELDEILDNSLKWTLLQLNSLNLWQLLPWNFPLNGLRADPTENTVFYSPLFILGVFTDQLPRNRRPSVVRVASCGNVFTESLPSNGSIHYNNIWIFQGIMYVEFQNIRLHPVDGLRCVWFVCMFPIGSCVQRKDIALPIGPSWVDFPWGRRQSSASE
jgi:hypothetical protein